MHSIVETYVAMQHYDDSPNPALLGCSPAEEQFNVESLRDLTHANHDGCPELRLWES